MRGRLSEGPHRGFATHAKVLLALILLGLLFGCRSHQVRSLYDLNSVETAQWVQRDKVIKELDISPIKPILLRSTWTSKELLRKGHYHLGFVEFPDIFVSFYGGFFWVSGQKGYFLVRDEDREAFDSFFRDP